MNRKWIFIFLMLIPLCDAVANSTISLRKVMQLAEKNSRFLDESQLREIAAQKSINIAEANYFPTIDAEAINTSGFPGSNGALGIEGIMGSPFRSELSAGVIAQQTLLDFGRTERDIKVARYEAKYSHENSKVTQYEIKQLALQTYYDCASFRTQRNTWSHLAKESTLITKEAMQFVRTGQRSIVDGYLSQAQTKEAKTATAFYAARLKESTRELAIIMGVKTGSFSCPALSQRLSKWQNSDGTLHFSPLVSRAIVGNEVAQAKLAREKVEYLPKVVLDASAGTLQTARLVPVQNYAFGIGVTMPLINEHTRREIQRARALAIAQEEEVDAQKQLLAESNGKYDEIIKSSEVRLANLSQELVLANKAFNVAKRRYFSLEGELVDLREAFTNLSRTKTDIDKTRAVLLQAKGSKALLNGK